MELYTNYIETARKIKNPQARAEFIDAIVWYVTDGTAPDFKHESSDIAFQAITPSLEKQRNARVAGIASANSRTSRPGTKAGTERPTDEGTDALTDSATDRGTERLTNEATERPTDEGTDGEQANKLTSYQANKLTSIVNPIVPYDEIIALLNSATGKAFRSTGSKTRSCIKARWNEGFRLDDFKAVIENKTAQWKNNPDMEGYLRPETLFGSKFEAYLNEKPRGEASSNGEIGIYASRL